jgi:Cu-Zn family superoxide dismutase
MVKVSKNIIGIIAVIAGIILAGLLILKFLPEGELEMPGSVSAVAVFQGPAVRGEAVALPAGRGCKLQVKITDLPAGEHGFHIHVAGDLRGEGCQGACQHFHKGREARHGGPPGAGDGPRHTGDLGNITLRPKGEPFKHTYILSDVRPEELWGRTLIVHADPDDLGEGEHEDSGTTGHSGARIGCAIFGRGAGCPAAAAAKTRKQKRKAH